MKQNYKSYFFNFSSSFFGGGLKRVLAYSKWFNRHGGATFVVSHHLRGIEKKFPANRYYFLRQNFITKAINYFPQLNYFISQSGEIDLYYSYGIPLSGRPGQINWFHLANVLTLERSRIYVKQLVHYKLGWLGYLINKNLKHADVISAESRASLSLIDKSMNKKMIVSVNGSDDEIEIARQYSDPEKAPEVQNIAVAVGTCKYKCIDDVYKVFTHLCAFNPGLHLLIVGIRKDVPTLVKLDQRVTLLGVMSQPQVCELLKTAKYYISSTLIENSYNAASEGAYLARESFVSDIAPHRELLKGVNYKVVGEVGTRRPCLHVRRSDLTTDNIKTWDLVVNEMVEFVENHRAKDP